MKFGADYYPEHWPITEIDRDIALMRKLGIDMVRMGEFAWNIFETQERHYNFTFFNNIIEKLGNAGIKTILGTPTATPPAWLCTKHPEILSKDKEGRIRSFGSRRHYCSSNPLYYKYTKKIVRKMAEYFKNNPDVIGWQIDNEIGHEGSDLCYCDECKKAFHNFLQEKYQSIDELNKQWGTMFWSQTYDDFSQIPLPVSTTVRHNPSMELDYYRFRSQSMKKYAAFQVDIIREIVPKDQFITTNLYPGYAEKSLDLGALMKPMDFVSYDNYPVWGGLKEPISSAANAFNLDLMRGLKQKNFWIMEQLSGAQGHNIIGYLPKFGQIKLWTYQAIARGAEAIVYFNWRSCRFGTEEFCHGILDHDGGARRRYQEIKDLIAEIKQLPSDFRERETNSQVAYLYDWSNIWAWKVQPLSTALDIQTEMLKYYAPLHYYNTSVDILPIDKCIEKYKLIIVPLLTLSSKETYERIENFVKQGGTAIFTYRTGVKYENNMVSEENPPGYYRSLLGIDIYEYEPLQIGQEVKIQGIEDAIKGVDATAKVWCDKIELNGAKSLAQYAQGYLGGTPAVTSHKYGEGKVYYIGSSIGENLLYPLYKEILNETQTPYQIAQKGVEIIKVQSKQSQYTFTLNHLPNYETKIEYIPLINSQKDN